MRARSGFDVNASWCRIQPEDLMAREIPYEEQTIGHPNPIARYVHRKRYLNSLQLVDSLLPQGGSILDFGAGQGELLHRVASRRPDARLLAFEPFMQIKYPEVVACGSMEMIEDKSIDVLCAFETLEHISDQQITGFMDQAIRVCKDGARILVSVPIMHGATLPVKQAIRSILFRRFSDYSIGEIARGVAGLRVARAKDILLSHKGFDHRVLVDLLTTRLRLLQTVYSPFRRLPWWTNSQAFFVLSVDRTSGSIP
jgi:SAM-dependent methyltransferase